MDTRHTHTKRLTGWAWSLRSHRTFGVVGMLLAGLAGPAHGADLADPTERAVAFIDRSSQATELFNAGRSQESLAVFQGLLACCSDLDEDGYVAMGVGDCLAALGRDEEAGAAYRALATSHPDLVGVVSQRLIELELAGEATDATIDLLRQAAFAAGEGRHTAEWRLGRALQMRAKALLTEAAAAFRAAAADDDALNGPGSLAFFDRLLAGHAALLDEVVENLADLIHRAEGEWGSARCPVLKRSCEVVESPSDTTMTEKSRAEWLVRTKDDRRIEFQSKRDEKGDVQITANGKAIKLTRTQRLMIQRHEERINTILLEAANDAAEASRAK